MVERKRKGSSGMSRKREFQQKSFIKKCKFFQLQVQFLGCIISSEGLLMMDPDKLNTIKKWPAPDSLKRL